MRNFEIFMEIELKFWENILFNNTRIHVWRYLKKYWLFYSLHWSYNDFGRNIPYSTLKLIIWPMDSVAVLDLCLFVCAYSYHCYNVEYWGTIICRVLFCPSNVIYAACWSFCVFQALPPPNSTQREIFLLAFGAFVIVTLQPSFRCFCSDPSILVRHTPCPSKVTVPYWDGPGTRRFTCNWDGFESSRYKPPIGYG